MVINISRAKGFQECRQKEIYRNKHRLSQFKVADPLILGGSYHKGLAHFFSTDNMTSAVLVAEQDYRQRYEDQAQWLLSEEKQLMERNVRWLANSLTEFTKHYHSHDIVVLQPEVEFTVPLPESEHFCKFVYQSKHPEAKDYTPEQWLECIGGTKHFGTYEDYVHPHYFRGKTDAVVAWQGRTWLFEHKTEARTGDSFFIRFVLDFQPTGYIYGIEKATGLRPQGFVLNIIKKPNAQYKGDPSNVIGFEREVYIRSDEDLLRFKRELIALANDYEESYFNPSKVYMNTAACTNWGRKCEYHDVCKNHGDINLAHYRVREELDYVEEALIQIANQKPARKE